MSKLEGEGPIFVGSCIQMCISLLFLFNLNILLPHTEVIVQPGWLFKATWYGVRL